LDERNQENSKRIQEIYDRLSSGGVSLSIGVWFSVFCSMCLLLDTLV
jgi:hypothetical protein